MCLGIAGCDGADNSAPPDGAAGQPASADARKPSAPDAASDATQTRPATTAPANLDKLGPELTVIFNVLRQRDTGGARIRLNKHLRLHPDDPQAIFLFGLSYHREQKYGEALPYYERALQIAPHYHLARYFRGWALYYLGRLEESKASFEAFLAERPDEPDSLFAMGLIALDEHDLDEAKARLQRSIDVWEAEDNIDSAALSKAYARLGEVHERQGDFAGARGLLETSVKLHPDHYEALYKLYRVLVRLGEDEEANRVHGQYLATRERVRPGTSFPE